MLRTTDKLPLVTRRPTPQGLRGPLTAQPLPLRWRRAKRWAERVRSRLDLSALRQMVAAERVGSG